MKRDPTIWTELREQHPQLTPTQTKAINKLYDVGPDKSQATIVTWNMADFKKASTLGVQVITPRQLLHQLETPQ